MNDDSFELEFSLLPKFKEEHDFFINRNKCPSLIDDLERLKMTMNQNFKDNNSRFTVERGYFPISGLNIKVIFPCFIIKRFRCKKIKKGADSGFRIVFIFDEAERKIWFVEIFHKNKKEMPDLNRINNLF
ncbi:hypothetical protein [Methanobrevibacter sp. DSM 116169]|uniref:hypothetical protein n=1 Tax=Methanobrevibacter sp. DSM 116169 TaxID=3242727 RepID=UPI0038FC9E5F